jgi:hypothetical protein
MVRHKGKEQTTANTATGTDVDVDAQLMDTDMQQMYEGLRNQLIPVVNLQTQAHNDAFVAAMIEYLTTGQLPTDRDLAKRLLFQTEDFFISNDQLFHLARIKNRKRLHLMTPRHQQLVVPKSLRMSLMQSIHEFSHFGFLKCYLTARQKFFWVGMATDFKTFIDSCLVCQQIKSTPQSHYPLTSIFPTSLFHTVTIDFHTVKQEARFQKDNIYRACSRNC